jgi:transcriptional regulator with XRE-family HTH domain
MHNHERLRRLRINLGLSINEMADALGLTGAGAGDKARAMERGVRDISGSILELMRYIEKYGLLAARDNNERLENEQ